MDGAACPLGGTPSVWRTPECTRAWVCVVCAHACLCVFLLFAWLHAHWADEEMRPATFPKPHEMLTRQRQPWDPNPSLSQASSPQPRHTGVT